MRHSLQNPKGYFLLKGAAVIAEEKTLDFTLKTAGIGLFALVCPVILHIEAAMFSTRWENCNHACRQCCE